MSNIKERIIGAVTIMSEEEAEKVWNLIQASFILSDVEEIEPDPEELEALRRYEAGEPDYQPSISAENLKRELGLYFKNIPHTFLPCVGDIDFPQVSC